MLCSFICRVVWFSTAWLALTGGTQAAVLTGRVVDSAGQPVAGAEVRIWQKLPAPNGPAVTDQPVKFGGGDVLVTDAKGTFTSPDVLVGEAFARIVAEARGTLAQRSGWIEIPKRATVVAPNITLKRLRAVLGEVRDREGRPVAGAVVFNSGDGHQRAETKTGRGGKFFLDGVPDGPVFLFVEKPGYRFTGKLLPAGQSEAGFTLVALEDAIEPLASLPPMLSDNEEISLAREVLASWSKELQRRGTDEQKFFFYAAVAAIDPLEALEEIDPLRILGQPYRALAHDGFLEIAVARSGELTADRLRAAIELGDHPFGKTSQYAKAARHLPKRELRRQLEWLDAALVHGRIIGNEALRMEALALIADTLFTIGERERAVTVLSDAENLARQLPQGPRPLDAFGVLALAAVHLDPKRAVEWMDKMKDHRDYPRHGVELTMRLLPERPELAEEVWRKSSAGNYMPELHDLLPLPWRPRVYLPDFCHRLARIDRPRAEVVAAATESAVLRVRGRGAIALALADTHPAEARRMLELLVREELPHIVDEDGLRFRRWGSRPTTAAWLLPIAERVAPDLCRELFWRSLALRLSRPRYDDFDDQIELADLRLARMLARYDREVARALLEPFALRAVQMTAAGGTELKSPSASQAAALAIPFARELAIAAAYVDPHWARQIIERLPYGREGSRFRPIDFARQAFVWVLARHGADRWSEANEVCAGFWEPK